MNGIIRKLKYALKAFFQLGWKSGLLFAWYQVQNYIGLLKLRTPQRPHPATDLKLNPLPFAFPTQKELEKLLGENTQSLIAQAKEILSGQVRLFGGPPQSLALTLPYPLSHWTKHKQVWVNDQDIKFTWEMGRFGWATVLGRAYHLTRDEEFARSFWQYTEEFLNANPPNTGPHWSSAQEVALRLIALTFCYTLFKDSPHTTEERTQALTNAVIAHAQRIPPTLSYARAQNNNHLLTEAAGLYTAAAVLPKHPQAPRWRKLGWQWFNHAIQNQIMNDGGYIQNSVNYHRLMLQIAMWVTRISKIHEDDLPDISRSRLAFATRWLLNMVDEITGQAPNLGPNDGAYILPLTTNLFEDYRPVLQAAGKMFLNKETFPSGPWDEMSAWLAPTVAAGELSNLVPSILRLEGEHSWAMMRAAAFKHRPGHADQLHVDLWWRGFNIAQDPGTYLYNAPPPWQNALSGTDVHNTITINNKHQMTPAGRFLWLDWAQAETLKNSPSRVSAQHFGYKHFGITHTRTVELMLPDTYTVTDTLVSLKDTQVDVRLHWLLPDWLWELEGTTLHLHSPRGTLAVRIKSEAPLTPSLARAGELVRGNGDIQPHHGWASPTYGVKEPALSYTVLTHTPLPVTITTRFIFPV